MKKIILFSSACLLLACNAHTNDEILTSLPLLDSLKNGPYEVNNNCITSGQYSIKILKLPQTTEKYPETQLNVFGLPNCKGEALKETVGPSVSFAGWSEEYLVYKHKQITDVPIMYSITNVDRIINDWSIGSISRKFYPVGDPVFNDNYVFYYKAIQSTYDHVFDETGLPPVTKKDCPTEQHQHVDNWLQQGVGLGLAQAMMHDLLETEPTKKDQVVCYPAVYLVGSPEEFGKEVDYEVEPEFDYVLPPIKAIQEERLPYEERKKRYRYSNFKKDGNGI